MISFGIDPGSHRTGFGVVLVQGNVLRWIDHGVIRTGEDDPLSERLHAIHSALTLSLAAHRPTHVFLESVFHHKSARSALILGHARGVALLAARAAMCSIGELTPAEVKQAVTGSGRADKHQIQHMVKALLGMPEAAPADAADALAVAIAGTTRARSPLARAIPSGGRAS